MLRVGLTGGIACGKSHVLRGLAAAGFGTLDLDAISHEVLASDRDVAAEVAASFGASVVVPGGGIDRKALGARVFAEAGARAQLNAILHPRIRAVEERRTLELSEVSGVVVTDGALLIESGGHLRFDRLVVVHCPEQMQIERLRRRDGLSAEEARQRLEAQMPTAQKRPFASFEVDTSAAASETDRQVAALAAGLRSLGAREPRRARLSARQVAACLGCLPEEGPRGLRPREVLAGAARLGLLDLGETSRHMSPRPEGAWYEAAESASGTGPESLALVAALWAVGVRGLDLDFAVAAAVSAARLTHRDGESLAAACLVGEALFAGASEGGVPVDWRERWQGWRREAGKWGAAGMPVPVAEALDAAALHAREVAAARAQARGSGGALAAALVALSVGPGDDERLPSGVAETCRALGFE